jgi:homoaconitase/3-isopropylmalate dehydratase large subunit
MLFEQKLTAGRISMWIVIMIHEVTSPQAFESMRLVGRSVRRPWGHLAVADHNVPTTGRAAGIADRFSTSNTGLLSYGVRLPVKRMTSARLSE